MSKKFKDSALREYLNLLAERIPAPGGGSAAALVAACGASLICMVAQYSIGRGKPARIEKRLQGVCQKAEKIRERMLELVDLDAEAYMAVVRARKGTVKDQEKANKLAAAVPAELGKLCRESVDLLNDLVEHGNPNLVSDVEAALDMLFAAYNSAMRFAHQ
jgi:formiminotetrahydrofolate cyclodeaminase